MVPAESAVVVPLATDPIRAAEVRVEVELPPRVERMEWLTAFRFFAALWVLGYHLNVRFPLPVHDVVRYFIKNGSYAMSFFFVLSGTVLAYGYADLATQPRGVMRFFVARFARIYPVYALAYLVALPWLEIPLHDWVPWTFVTVMSLLGIQAWFPHTFVGANTGLWSISCELFFYALFPTLLTVAASLARREHFARAVIYLTLFIGFIGLADFAFLRVGTFPIYYISPALRLPEFFLGMVLGMALRQRPASPPTSAPRPWLAGVLVLAVSSNRVHEVGLWMRANIIVVPTIAWFIYASGVYDLTQPRHPLGFFRRFLRYLGAISYCFFLAQLPLLLWFDEALLSGSGAARWIGKSAVGAWGIAMFATVLASIALHEAVEKPVRRRLMRLFAPAPVL